MYQDIRRQLINELAQKLFICFSNQAKKIVPAIQKAMRAEFEEEIKKSIFIFIKNYL